MRGPFASPACAVDLRAGGLAVQGPPGFDANRLALLYAAMVEPEHPAPARKPDLDGALARLQAALAVLEAAAARKREAELAQADLAEAFAAMQDDRARLALDLDEVLSRARKLETANEEVARRLESAGLALKTLIAGSADSEEPDEVD